MLKQNIISFLLCIFCASAFATDNSVPVGNAHLTIKDLNQVVDGDASLLTKNKFLLVSAVNTTPNKMDITLQTTNKLKKVSISVSPELLKNSFVKIGQNVQLIQEKAGTVFTIQNNIIAFIPNELGKKFFYSLRKN